MSRLAVDLFGYGRVARALLGRLHGSGIEVATIHDRSGLRASRPARGGRRVFVDVTSPQYEGDEADAWVGRLEEVLSGGAPLVTCNKAPLAIGWRRLLRAAQRGNTTISCTATVGAGTPILPHLRWLQRSHGVTRVEGILNATLDYVIERVGRGTSVEEAVRRAKGAGWAEPDPTLDLDGTDAYAKAVIIHNILFPSQPALSVDARRPRLRLSETGIRDLARDGRTPRAVVAISPETVRLGLRPVSFANGYSGTFGTVKVRAVLRDGSEALLAGRGAGPRFTAGGILGDLLALSGYNRRHVEGVIA